MSSSLIAEKLMHMARGKKKSSARWRGMALAIGLLVVAIGAWRYRQAFFGARSPPAQAEPPNKLPLSTGAPASQTPPLPPIRPTRFLNAAPDVRFIGSQACAKCHPGEHESYQQTAHSRALESVDLAAEPRDAAFAHPDSGREYQVLRRGGQMIHRQAVPGPSSSGAVAEERVVRYAIGSGHHSRSYLAEIDGFLVESPLTWYASTNTWDLSPGFDRPPHPGFERIADLGCLLCHAGRVEPVAENRYRVAIQEGTIGCESCHGPGELHAARHSVLSPVDDEDLTIVHPARLTREERESICAQCHLRGAATVPMRGRRGTEFRPSLKLSDFQIHFFEERPSRQMKVVGHVEQMQASACYRKSETLTCTSCHHLHAPPLPDRRVAFYRERCLACHDDRGCTVDEAARRVQSPEDDCAACHMPQQPTDLPHFAFTHHRIGLHADSAAGESATDSSEDSPLNLVPAADLGNLAAGDRARLLGLAFMEYADLHASPHWHRAYRRRAAELLARARDAGASDVRVAAALARLAWEAGENQTAQRLASEALVLPDPATGSHADCRFILADLHLQAGNAKGAIPFLERLTSERRMAEPWLLLGQARVQTGDFAGAEKSLLTAIEISPFRADLRHVLAELYRRRGDTAAARQQADLADRLGQLPPARE